MPVKSEKKRLYHKDWDAIRAEVIRRAGNQCERCGVNNRAYGYRDPEGEFQEVTRASAEALSIDGEVKVIRIVLTLAHLDHDPSNNGIPGARPNLLALCQRCANLHDLPHRKNKAARTRHEADRLYAEQMGQEELELEE